MYAYAETASDIGNLSITVDGREQTEAIYNQAVCLAHILFVGTGVAHVGAFQLADNLHQVVLVDDMRGDNQLHFRMLVEVLDKQVLVRLPGTSRHKGHGVVLEQFHQRQFLRFLTDLQHTVETGITHHRHAVDAYLRQITLGALILHKQMVEIAQHMPISAAIPLEEHLPTAENGRDAIGRDAALVQLVQIVLPEFIFYEKRHAGIHNIQKLLHIARFVERQVADDISSPVVLTHLVAGRREESKQNAVIGVSGTDFLHQRTSLLKLPQRSGMKPDVTHILLQLLPEKFVHHPMPLHHFPGLPTERSKQMHQEVVNGYGKVVYHY